MAADIEAQAAATGKGTLLTEVNIGVVGHVDHGKTSLVQALTGKWASVYKEELKRGITIRLGYADTTLYQCPKDATWCTTDKCPKCFGPTEAKRAISIVDAPGHETLMATVLSGASLMDGAILVIAANEDCPRPQTAEHLKALDIAGIKNVIIAQNKVDLVSEEQALKNYEQIKAFVKGTVAEKAPVVPISALHNANIDMLIAAIQDTITTPKRNLEAEPRFYVARSFDVNKPGTPIDQLKGGVIGGSLTQGRLSVGDEIEIVPGPKVGATYKPIRTKIVSIIQAGAPRQTAMPGGLVALQTELDPALTRGDSMVGNIAGLKGKLPACMGMIKFKPHLFDYVIGVAGRQPVEPIKTGDALLVTAAIAKSVGVVTSAAPNRCELNLKIPICAEPSAKLAIARQVAGRWHLIGWGEIL
ncbi:MAG: translation initiation factor IF-2 subunit gamma [Candidatus Aenigmatarchaeota archaeon]